MVVCGGFKTRHKSSLYPSHSGSFSERGLCFCLRDWQKQSFVSTELLRPWGTGSFHPPSPVTFGTQTPRNPGMKSTPEEAPEEKPETSVRSPAIWASHAHLPAAAQPAQVTLSRSGSELSLIWPCPSYRSGSRLIGCFGFKPLSWGIIC